MILRSCLFLMMYALTFLAFGQIDTFPPEAEMKLVAFIEHEKFTFKLDRFHEVGVPNLSMSKGKEFIRIGADLPTILKEVWPKEIFEIHPRLLEDKYHLMIQHLDHEATDEFFVLILEEWIKDNRMNMHKKNKHIRVNCVSLIDPTMLSNHMYKQEEGIVKSISKTSDQMNLKGYTLQEMLGILSHESGEIFITDQNEPKGQFTFKINTTSPEDSIKSLQGMGLNVQDCMKELEVVTIE